MSVTTLLRLLQRFQVLLKGFLVPSTFKELGGYTKQIRKYADENDKTWSAFNPSIGISDAGAIAIAFRSSNYVILSHGELHVATGGKIKNHVWFAEMDEMLQLENMRKLDFSAAGIKVVRGVEDPKLLWRDGRWVFTGVMLEDHTPVARNCVCYPDKKVLKVERIEPILGIDAGRPEKNWMTANIKPKTFDFIYDANAVVIGDKVVHTLRDNKKLNALRGNAHLVSCDDGTYIGLMHQLKIKKFDKVSQSTFGVMHHVHKFYTHVFVRFNEYGSPVEISDHFKFDGDGIEFAAGIIPYGEDYVISYGKDDRTSHLAVISQKKVNRLLKSIG
jgi:hypothetical protein